MNGDEIRPEWLAAHADGELPPELAARVERWLRDHPEAREAFEDQQSLSPRNTEFWQGVEPPRPSWPAVTMPPRNRWIGKAVLGTAVAASLMILLWPDRPPETTSDPVAMEAPYLFASNAEVRIISLPESTADLLVTGEHPLAGTFLIMARGSEVEFHGIGADQDGRFPEVTAEPHAEDVPIVWAKGP